MVIQSSILMAHSTGEMLGLSTLVTRSLVDNHSSRLAMAAVRAIERLEDIDTDLRIRTHDSGVVKTR